MTDIIDITATRAIFNAGQFDTENGYLRTAAGTGQSKLVAGDSIRASYVYDTAYGQYFRWNFTIGDYTCQNGPDFRGVTGTTAPTNTVTEFSI